MKHKKVKNSKFLNKILTYTKANDKKIKILLLILICCVMVIKGIMQQPQILANKSEIQKLKQEIEYEKNRQADIQKMRENIETDEYIERIARDKLGMMKQNEKVFIDASATE